jgi:DNA-binding transcriptional ArsR family regulator
MSFAGASKHVKVLEDAGLIARRKAGRTHLISIEAKPLEEAERWLRQWEKFWNVRLDRLEALIERDKEKENEND